jgi:hypothetical protein
MSPWNILSASLTLADVAKSIYTSIKKDKKPEAGKAAETSAIDDIYKKIEMLAQAEVKQAELIAQLAEQVKLNNTRARTAILLSVIAFLLSAACLIVLLIKF